MPWALAPLRAQLPITPIILVPTGVCGIPVPPTTSLSKDVARAIHAMAKAVLPPICDRLAFIPWLLEERRRSQSRRQLQHRLQLALPAQRELPRPHQPFRSRCTLLLLRSRTQLPSPEVLSLPEWSCWRPLQLRFIFVYGEEEQSALRMTLFITEHSHRNTKAIIKIQAKVVSHLVRSSATIVTNCSTLAALTPLPHYAKKAAHLSSSSGDPYSPTPTYTSFGPQQTQQETTNPQEIMGLGLSAAEFNRRSKSRIPFQHSDGPVELGSERPSGNRPDLGARSPLLESDSANTNDERTSISAQWPGSQGAQGARFQESI